jgi:hypothetical protein
MVSSADHEFASSKKWCCFMGRYAIRHDWNKQTKTYLTVYLHRLIAGARSGQEVDHKNGNGFDNRRSNLRICTHAQNMANSRKHSNNSSGYAGVSFNSRRRKYYAFIRHGGRAVYLGGFSNAADAADVYRETAHALRGDFAGV